MQSIWAEVFMNASVQGDCFHCHWNWFRWRRRPGRGATERIQRSKGEGERGKVKGMFHAGATTMEH